MLNTISKYFNKNLFYDLKILNDFINDINYFNHIYLYIYKFSEFKYKCL